jgi:hypothetical protein
MEGAKVQAIVSKFDGQLEFWTTGTGACPNSLLAHNGLNPPASIIQKVTTK